MRAARIVSDPRWLQILPDEVHLMVATLLHPYPEHGWTLAPDVWPVEAPDGSGRLLNLNRGFHAVNASGWAMLEAIRRGREADFIDEQTALHLVPPERIAADLDRIRRALICRGLLVRSRREPTVQTGSRGLRCRGMTRLVHWVFRRGHSPEACVGPLLVLAWISFRWLGWDRTLAAFRAAAESVGSRSPRRPAEQIGDAVWAAAARMPLGVNCKERAVTAWALLRAQGDPARIVIGASLYPLGSHTWCSLDGTIIADHVDRCEQFTELTAFDGPELGRRPQIP